MSHWGDRFVQGFSLGWVDHLGGPILGEGHARVGLSERLEFEPAPGGRVPIDQV